MSMSKALVKLDGPYIEVGPVQVYGIPEEDRARVTAALKVAMAYDRTLLLNIIGVVLFVGGMLVSMKSEAQSNTAGSTLHRQAAAR